MPLFPRSKKSRKPAVAGSNTAIARQTKTTTTYKAGTSALAQIPRPQLDSESGSSQPIRIVDQVPELTTPFQRTRVYAQMMTDAGVDMSVRAVKTPVLGAEFFMEPYSDSPLDMLVSQFVWENLAAGMSAPFLNSLEDILHFFEDGYSVIEKVYENRVWAPNAKGANTRQYTMLRKLGVRPAATIKEIVYDNNGGPTKITQNAIQADGSVVEKDLDITKVMVFTFGKVGGDLTGKSILRTAYAHWYYKTHFYKIDAIQKERHGIGVPRGKLGPAATNQDKVALRNALRNLRTNEEAFIIETPNVEVDFVELKGMTVDALESAAHHNLMILMNVMAQFLASGIPGSSSGGGRNTAAAGVDIFMKTLKFVANLIAQNINMYLIPELVVWNFPTTNFPRLKVRNIGETRDLQMLGAALGNLLSQQGITMDDATEDWIREVFDMPSKIPGAAPTPPANTVSTQANGTASNGAQTTPPVPPLASGGRNGGTAPTNQQKGAIKPNAIKTGNVGKAPAQTS
jgi:hypothetical protein